MMTSVRVVTSIASAPLHTVTGLKAFSALGQGVLPRISREGHEKNPSECEAVGISELLEAENHPTLAILRLSPICPE